MKRGKQKEKDENPITAVTQLGAIAIQDGIKMSNS